MFSFQLAFWLPMPPVWQTVQTISIRLHMPKFSILNDFKKKHAGRADRTVLKPRCVSNLGFYFSLRLLSVSQDRWIFGSICSLDPPFLDAFRKISISLAARPSLGARGHDFACASSTHLPMSNRGSIHEKTFAIWCARRGQIRNQIEHTCVDACRNDVNRIMRRRSYFTFPYVYISK